MALSKPTGLIMKVTNREDAKHNMRLIIASQRQKSTLPLHKRVIIHDKPSASLKEYMDSFTSMDINEFAVIARTGSYMPYKMAKALATVIIQRKDELSCVPTSKSTDKLPVISKQVETPAGYKWVREDQERSLKNAAQPAWRLVKDQGE